MTSARPGTHRAYVGIGSNLEGPAEQVRRALCALDACTSLRLFARSRLYGNPPVGPIPQPDYVNAAAGVETALGPRALLETLLAVEASLGRVRGAVRWGPRVIDLDLLCFDEIVVDEPGLEVPHPRLAERAFVLVPLAEIAPRLRVPGHATVDELRRRLADSPLEPLDESGLAMPLPAPRGAPPC